MSDNDTPSKAEARGVRHKKRNPYANKLRDKLYRQRVVKGGKDARRKRSRPDGFDDSGDNDWDSDL